MGQALVSHISELLQPSIDVRPCKDKEHWEPMLQTLFKIRSTKSPPHRIREAWAFDWQNHGHSAVLNSETLKTRPDGVCEFALRRR